MSKKGVIDAYGEVLEALGNGMFRVKLDTDFIVLCQISGRMRKFYIKVIPGDRVKVEMSPYDLTKGRISERIGGTMKKDEDERETSKK